jgi:hypothetical protein
MTTPARGAPLRSAGGFAPRPSLSSYTTPGDTTEPEGKPGQGQPANMDRHRLSLR